MDSRAYIVLITRILTNYVWKGIVRVCKLVNKMTGRFIVEVNGKEVAYVEQPVELLRITEIFEFFEQGDFDGEILIYRTLSDLKNGADKNEI